MENERIRYLSTVNKRNKKGKMQLRLLCVTDAAVYNFNSDGQKLKRRIPLELITSITRCELSSQFLLHVPSEYDYDLVATHPGIELGVDGSIHELTLEDNAPSVHAIRVIQSVYASHFSNKMHLPVRSWASGGLSQIAQLKTARQSSSNESVSPLRSMPSGWPYFAPEFDEGGNYSLSENGDDDGEDI